jgi:hypothetical protein
MAKNEMTQEQIDALIAEKAKKEQRSAELAAKRKEKSEALEGESKANAFKRIAKRRVNNVLSMLDTLQGLTSTANYEFTPEQWGKIFGAVEERIAELKAAAAGDMVVKGGFDL